MFPRVINMEIQVRVRAKKKRTRNLYEDLENFVTFYIFCLLKSLFRFFLIIERPDKPEKSIFVLLYLK